LVAKKHLYLCLQILHVSGGLTSIKAMCGTVLA
jgi:hypothetical protein